MIIKKLWRKINYNRFQDSKIIDIKEYLGWFLFGFIPIYLIELDKYTKVEDKDGNEETVKWGINKTYKHILEK